MKRVLLWFRRDLRLTDNLALHKVKQAKEIIPIYIVESPKHTLVGCNRWQFLLDSLTDLNNSLTQRHSQLLVARGDAIKVLTVLLKEWQITHLAFDGLTEPHAIDRDRQVRKLAKELNIEVIQTEGKLLYHPSLVIEKNGKLPKTYASFTKICDQLPLPNRPLPIPSIPSLPSNLNELKTISSVEPFGTFELFNLSEYTKDTPTTTIRGGETEALKLLSRYCKDKLKTTRFEKPKTSPADFDPPSTTVLSPHTTWGCISPRDFYWRVKDLQQHDLKSSSPPVSLIGQLLWRDFFHCQGYAIPNFDNMNGNPVCLQIPWDTNQEFLDKWKYGQTGYPWIDAIMIQLRTQGWMHHLARHSVACFLTRGDLYLSWVKGKEVFQEWLLDHDWNLNAANWMWLSASSYFTSYFRIYSPITFGQKVDKDGLFIKKFIPQLAKYPSKYIYEPWKATKQQQKDWGCIIGTDYPFPIVDHKEASTKNKDRMKEAYSKKEHGKVVEKRKHLE